MDGQVGERYHLYLNCVRTGRAHYLGYRVVSCPELEIRLIAGGSHDLGVSL